MQKPFFSLHWNRFQMGFRHAFTYRAIGQYESIFAWLIKCVRITVMSLGIGMVLRVHLHSDFVI